MIGRLAKSKLFWLASAGVGAILLYLAFAVFGVQAAFVDREVNESFSPQTEATGATEAAGETSTVETTESSDYASTEATVAGSTTTTTGAGESAGAPTSEVAKAAKPAEPAEPAGPVKVLAGSFHDAEYEGTGEAGVYRLEDGSHVLRLENLNVDNGPDLFVYAVAAGDAFDSATVEEAGFVSAGPLKGNQGNQTYDLPAGFDPEVHGAITVWCQRFSGNFATAPLSPA